MFSPGDVVRSLVTLSLVDNQKSFNHIKNNYYLVTDDNFAYFNYYRYNYEFVLNAYKVNVNALKINNDKLNES